MSNVGLLDRVLKHVGEFLETDVSMLQPKDSLTTSIDGLTSLKMMELVLYLEECFGVEFDESAVEKLDTLQDLVDYVEARLPAAVEAAGD